MPGCRGAMTETGSVLLEPQDPYTTENRAQVPEYNMLFTGRAAPASGSTASLRDRIVNFVFQQTEPVATLAIAKELVGRDATKKSVNPTLYSLEKENVIRKVKDVPPMWAPVYQTGRG
uniref:Z-binding domain-containing protein n=1 Tax=Chromera velia CCMP2878 TaxID=1169474 RepID=A0A0G4HAW8_9ALVE|eukprot:Cvel_25803.t1-p1 / transcript=Cvel_25803.t1 / gene=Cvel_25803 / organism=Chromera_velia_CCMP2878 / gene_product=hypothetical protein / transcript_product=hypothetical protein / location=Cvel_scaffold2973:15898-16248(+) / protein_length=117 / sequence_SO=supercontig / SO=protein_coding / is_pseudo=false